MVELEPERLDELAALVAHHMEEGGEPLEAARWSARAAYWAGSSQPAESQRLWRKTMELTEGLEESEETAALAVASRLQQLQYAWRLGMDREEEARLAAEAEQIATRKGDLHSLAMLRMATAARPGMRTRRRPGSRRSRRSTASPTNPATRTCGWRCARRAPTPSSAPAISSGFERELDQVLELAGGDRSIGAGIVIGSPIAWATMGKGLAERELGRLDEAEALFEEGLRIASEDGDPETMSWTRSNLSLMLAMRGDVEGAIGMARRNCEETERLGDVFSRTLALSNLGAVQLAAEDHAEALASLEEAERLYREAMGNGGEMEAWRAALRA